MLHVVLYAYQIKLIIIHCSIFSYFHWSRAYVEFSVFLSWREHMTNKCRICHVLTPSETNTRFICMCSRYQSYVCLSVYNMFVWRLLGLLRFRAESTRVLIYVLNLNYYSFTASFLLFLWHICK